MTPRFPHWWSLALAGALALAPTLALAGQSPSPSDLALVNRLTWGVNASSLAAISHQGAEPWIEAQLHPTGDAAMPAPVQREIEALPVSRTPLATLVVDLQAQNDAANQITDPDRKKAAHQAYEQALNDLARQAATRQILRDLYSPNQLQEQMTWFWFNHFNVHAGKANLRAMVGDYEDQAIRPHALGRFRDLLEATLRHPAMLRYLDNAENAAGRINENYARELLELHTLGVGSGYSQADVQNLARILTGVGVDARHDPPNVRPALRGQLIREGLFEFNPNRHDYGDKILLGHLIHGEGFSEVEQALDILASQPATAEHLSRQMAAYFMGDNPPDAVVQRMAGAYQRSDGDIAEVLRALFHSPEFKASLARGAFKDPAHYTLSAVRYAYDDRMILNTAPIQSWLNRLAEGLYNHQTPDGYPSDAAAWTGPGQMTLRFEIARQIGSGGAGLFKPDGPAAVDHPGYPQLQNALYFQTVAQTLSKPTREALDQAVSPQDWNTLFLASPEFMRR